MKTLTMNHLDEKDEEIADTLISLGMNRPIGKGRPNKIYSLKVGFSDIIAQLEKQKRKAVDETFERIERLKELGR